MTNFPFDESKSFSQNCHGFLETLKSDDPEMGTCPSSKHLGQVRVFSNG